MQQAHSSSRGGDENSHMVVCLHRWQDARLMPGAARLLWHLHSHSVAMALATSTPRATYEAKMCGKAAQSLCSVFQASTMQPMDPCLTPALL